MARFRGVILDVDGTLVASNDAHAKAWMAAMAAHGFKIPFETVRKLIGMGGDKLMPTVIGVEEESPVGKKIAKRRKEVFLSEHLPNLFPTPGAEELLEHLKERGFKLAVASSATEEELSPLLRVCRADQFVQAKTSSDDAENSKPDPDIVLAALRQLGMTSKETVMLGDTPYDVQAAKKAGVQVIALRSGGRSDAELAGALAIYDHPAHLLHEFDRSPLA
jgi:HAD superfamily hydrolase (TIGR01509 family)